MNVSKLIPALLSAFAMPSSAGAQLPDIIGTLDQRLAAGTRMYASAEFTPATDVHLPGIDGTAPVLTATMQLFHTPSHEPVRAAFVDRGANSVIYIDANLDGQFGAGEGIAVEPSARTSSHDYVKDLHLPFVGEPIAPLHFDVVRYTPSSAPTLRYNVEFRAQGHADIDGVRTLVTLPFEFDNGRVNTRLGFMGIDVNGDGQIPVDGTTNQEVVWTRDEPKVVHVRNAYVHVESADFATHSFTLKQHAPKDFTFEETVVGKKMFDFEFLDTKGAKHRISDYKGKMVLLDFWGTWCAPCLADIPELKSLYEANRDRSFEIIGVDYEPKLNPETVKAVNERFAVPWVLTDPASVTNTIHVTLRVEAFPTYVLLDQDGVVVTIARGGPLKNIASALEAARH